MKPGALYSIVLVASMAIASMQGCATRIEMGSPPRVERLAQLTPRVSTRNDVLLTLGEPRGYGAARLDNSFQQQRVWLYEYTISEGTSIQFTMLLIFFSGDAYDGYMWFADASNIKEYPGGKGR